MTLEFESWLWDLMQLSRDSSVLSSWERQFMDDNRKRYEDDRKYFVSGKMAQIMTRIDEKL